MRRSLVGAIAAVSAAALVGFGTGSPALGAPLRLVHAKSIVAGQALAVTINSSKACSLTARLGSQRVALPAQTSRGGKVRVRIDTTGWVAGTWALQARCGKSQARSRVTVTAPAPAPVPPTSGVATFGDASLDITWEHPATAADVASFAVKVSRPGVARELSTVAFTRAQSFTAANLVGIIGSGIQAVQVSIAAIDRDGRVSEPLVLEATNDPPQEPAEITAERGTYAYTMSWGPRPADATSTQVFEALSPEGPYRRVATTSGSSATVSTGVSDDRRWVRVAHVDAFGLSSAQAPEAGISVKPRCICVDIGAPEQRTEIAYEPRIETVRVTWTNPTDEELNADVAGVEIRYRRADQPGNFFWHEVRFTYAAPLTEAEVGILFPNTDYVFQIRTFDDIYNRTSYSDEVTVRTLKRPCFGCPGSSSPVS